MIAVDGKLVIAVGKSTVETNDYSLQYGFSCGLFWFVAWTRDDQIPGTSPLALPSTAAKLAGECR